MPSSLPVRLIMRIASSLPLPVLFRVTRAATRLMRLRQSRAETITRVNLALCFPEMAKPAREKLVTESLWHDALALAECAPFYTWPGDKLAARVDTPDDAVLHEALAEKRGVLLCAPHFGAWELLGQVLSLTHDLHVLYKPSKRPEVDNILLPGRTRFGVTLHPTNAAGVRGMNKALAANGIVSILPDQEPDPAGGEFAPFFGEPALTMTLLTRLARKRKVPVLLTAAVRDTDQHRYRLVHRRLDDTIYSTDATEALTSLNAAIERLARDNPEQYLWSYRRFDTLPSGGRRQYSQPPSE